MIIGLLHIFAIICIASVCGKLISKLKLPAILGWLIAGIVFGPYLAEVVTLDITNALWYKVLIKFFECFAGVMIGREIIFKKIAKSGKQIIGITFVQSIGTFIFVTAAFSVVFVISDIPVYLAFIFGGIALATAPAPALSIVNEYHTNGPVTKTLLPLAAIDDIIGVIVFFTVISIVSGVNGSSSASPFAIAGMVLLPFAIGIFAGLCASLFMKKTNSIRLRLVILLFFLCVSALCGLLIDHYLFHSFSLNYLLIGMAFSAAVVNVIPEEELTDTLKLYNPLLNLSLVIVIVNLGMPLDYRLIAGAGLFTVIYILSRAVGKIGGAYLGGKLTKAEPVVTKYLGFTLLPHSGVSLVFTGIAATTLTAFDASLAAIVSGTIVAAAIINEIIAVIVAKFAFNWAGEIEE
ncbi:cation:proton antiporter [Diplocloster agilis]|uniref:Cation:proton antiporter n=1 Tax=Diplocloster agilis TaxID=2850323 RepID=A0A949K7F8_9FIRM|nr:cation:proton antiporter [Diplocloster agilis]MBU9736912.1 cation:proton antiporter [Diplocloster agilis]MBU9743923.1 cation:proton antiporter [Diplocloster agilis]